MLEWFKRLLGVTRLDALLHIHVEDVHCRVDELAARAADLVSRVELLEANVTVHKRHKNYFKKSYPSVVNPKTEGGV